MQMGATDRYAHLNTALVNTIFVTYMYGKYAHFPCMTEQITF